MKPVHVRASVVLGLGVFAAAAAGWTQKLPSPASQANVHADDTSMGGYRQHLLALETLVDGCAKGRDAKSCDPALAGGDDRVAVSEGSNPERRLVRYGWLRTVLQKAGSKDEPQVKGKDLSKKTAGGEAEQAGSLPLRLAKARLEKDLEQARGIATPGANYAKERAVMREVLAGKEFRNLQEQTVQDSVLEKFARWLNHLFAGVAFLKMRSAWIGRVLVWGFIVGVCVALGYSLIRLERRWRVRLTPDDDQLPAAGAASARDWQLWLDDARREAGNKAWREAIHFLYWAAISRLESRRLWPADRARTPREYLALVGQEDPRKPGLSQLTDTFERFWYGGRAAGESDYSAAERVATRLIHGASTSAGPDGGVR